MEGVLPWAFLSPAALNIPVIYMSWRKYTGPDFFWLLHCYSQLCLICMLEVTTPWSGQHVFQYVSAFTTISILSLIINYFQLCLFILDHFLEITLSLQYSLV